MLRPRVNEPGTDSGLPGESRLGPTFEVPHLAGGYPDTCDIAGQAPLIVVLISTQLSNISTQSVPRGCIFICTTALARLLIINVISQAI